MRYYGIHFLASIILFFVAGCFLGSSYTTKNWQKDAVKHGYGQYVVINPTALFVIFMWNDEITTATLIERK